MMPRLAIYDDARTAADVRARAFAVFERRRAAYVKLAVEVPPDEPKEQMESKQPAESERPSGPTWEAICKEVARQTGIPGGQLKLGSEGRGQPHVAFKQLAMALTCKLTRLSLKTTARLFGLNNHTTVLHAKKALAPILNATGLTEVDSVPEWVSETLPLLFVSIGQQRANNRRHGEAVPKENGKFARETYNELATELSLEQGRPNLPQALNFTTT
jgi:hypothetical protein